MTSIETPHPPAADQLGRVHLMGVGGAGMSGIARILHGPRPVRSAAAMPRTRRVLAPLRALGARWRSVTIRRMPTTADTVVVSSAIRATNPELLAARELGRRVLPRAAALASVMAGRYGLAIAGTHGKTTTTSMLTVAMQACGRDPSYAIGGDLNEPGSNAHQGTGEFFVAEADESDRSFLLLSPRGAVITNVEPDHLDNYGDAGGRPRGLRRSSSARVEPGGIVLLGADDAGSDALAPLGARARAAGPAASGWRQTPTSGSTRSS